MKDQALESIFIQAKEECTCRGCQQKTLRRLSERWQSLIKIDMNDFLNSSKNINWCYTLLIGIQNESGLEEAEGAKIKYEQLNMISENRLVAIYHHQLYKN